MSTGSSKSSAPGYIPAGGAAPAAKPAAASSSGSSAGGAATAAKPTPAPSSTTQATVQQQGSKLPWIVMVIVIIIASLAIGYMLYRGTPQVATNTNNTVANTPPANSTAQPVVNPRVTQLIADIQHFNDDIAKLDPAQDAGLIAQLQFKIKKMEEELARLTSPSEPLIQTAVYSIPNPNKLDRYQIERANNGTFKLEVEDRETAQTRMYTQANARQEQLTALGAQLKAQREYSNANLDLLREQQEQNRRFMEDLLRDKKEEEARRQQAEEIPPPPTSDKSVQSQYQNVYVYGASTVKSNSSTQPATTTIYPRRSCR